MTSTRQETTAHPALGDRLVVVDVLAYCDSLDHEARMVTDGTRLYAGGTGPRGVDHGVGWRNGNTVYVTCKHPDRFDDLCDGVLSVELSEWTSDPQALAILDAYGRKLDQ